jgi:hypothetical protein
LKIMESLANRFTSQVDFNGKGNNPYEEEKDV